MGHMIGGKLVHRMVTPAQAELLQHAIDNHRRAKQLMREWEEQTERLIDLKYRANLDLPATGNYAQMRLATCGKYPLRLPRLEVRRAGNCVDMPNVPARQEFRTRCMPGLSHDRTQRPGVGVHGAGSRNRPRPCPTSGPTWSRTARSGACSGSATGCRRWGDIDTLTWVSCVGMLAGDL